jgi:hypothetical protein
MVKRLSYHPWYACQRVSVMSRLGKNKIMAILPPKTWGGIFPRSKCGSVGPELGALLVLGCIREGICSWLNAGVLPFSCFSVASELDQELAQGFRGESTSKNRSPGAFGTSASNIP